MQTIEFETAKKFDKLGLKKECYINIEEEKNCYHMYTLDEILAMLPEFIDPVIPLIYWIMGNGKNRSYYFEYRDLIRFGKLNPAEAAAQLLIWCIEQGYVKVEEVNNE